MSIPFGFFKVFCLIFAPSTILNDMKKKKRVVFGVLLCALLCVFVFSGVCLIRKNVDVRLSFDGEQVLSKTYPLSFSHALIFGFYRYDAMRLCEKKFSGDVLACLTFLHASLPEDVSRTCLSFDVAAKEPVVTFSEKGFSYTDGQNGLRTDVSATLAALLSSPTFSAEISHSSVAPLETVDDLKERTVSISAFSTSYASSSPSRKKNVAVAAKRLSGLTVLPGEELSFNETVGVRSTENGFFEAPVIENGVYTTGVGGGVCQVASTLYDAWLYAGQNVSYSRAHSLTPHYVTPGLDAMVSASGDLVLKNDSPYPLYVLSRCDGNVLTFEIFGKKPPFVVSLRSELVKTIPYDEYETVVGAENKILRYPKPSTVYRSYRFFTQSDGTVSKELLRTSYYLPQKGKKSVTSENNDEENRPQ